jgi:plastocyanin
MVKSAIIFAELLRASRQWRPCSFFTTDGFIQMTLTFRSHTLAPIAAVAAIALVTACSSTPSSAPARSGGDKTVDPATAGSIAGRATFTGPAPAAVTLRMSSDAACVQESGPNTISDAVLISADGALKNVFVYVREGLDPVYGFDVPTSAVILDQKGCRYTPRVVGVRVGQPLEIVNSDPTLHNVHALPTANAEFNQGQPVQGFRTTRTFTTQEVMVRFKCDVHSWMSAHVGVVAHPYFAITNDDGSFEIKNLPPGTYTLEAWHEKFGTQIAKVTIGDKQAQTTSFTFSAKPEGDRPRP